MKRILAILALALFAACHPKTGATDAGTDAGPTCADDCTRLAAACAQVTADACNAACKDARAASCLASAANCSTALACTKLRTPTVPFAGPPYGSAIDDVAGPFTVPTLAGTYDFQQSWTGDDSTLFVIYAPGVPQSQQLWASDVSALLAATPPDVQYFFMSYKDADGTDRAAQHVSDLKSRFDTALGSFSPADATRLSQQLHYVTTAADGLGNWISDLLKARGLLDFGIDRFQRIRNLGALATLGPTGFTPALSTLADEARHFDFEWTREQGLDRNATVVQLINGESIVSQKDVDVTLPDLSSFDTLRVDLTLDCTSHDPTQCGPWDYLGHLYVCDAADPTTCTTELARFITAYGREARWVTDVSPLLPLLGTGGARRLRFKTNAQPANHPYVVSLSLRLSNQGKGMRPVAAVPLWQGGTFDATYDSAHPPMDVPVPADAKKVAIVATITGHGWGADIANCAEFCDHAHHFTVGADEHVIDFPMAGTNDGCEKQVPTGVIPNQYGTWPLGRGGWCPGADVPPHVIDVTSDVTPGQSAHLVYTATVNGQPYVPTPNPNPPQNAFAANIDLESWLVFYR